MVCSICDKYQDSTKRHIVYTARNLGETRRKWWGGVDVTARYGEFEQHTFNVCRLCFIKHTYIYPLVTYLIAVPLIMLVLSIKLGGALFFALIPAGFAFWKLNVTSTLIRIAISSRRRASSNAANTTKQRMSDYKGYSSWEMLPARLSHEAEVVKTIQSQTSDRCWFCQNRLPNGTPLDVRMSYEGSKETIWVPRCADCEKVHRRNTRLAQWGSVIPSAMILGLAILAGVLSSKFIGGWAWIVGVIVFLTLMLGLILLLRYACNHLAAQAGTHPVPYSHTYPEIKDRVDHGWQIISQGNAKGNPSQ